MATASPGDARGDGRSDGRSSTTPAPAFAMRPPTERTVSRIPNVLPHERVFPIQIGSELFKLSGAALSSDAPSYFSQYFLCQLRTAQDEGEGAGATLRTLYIDRDPATFRDIALHLQGYHLTPRDSTHFVRLFADAQFYSLPRLISQLYEESVFVCIGGREFAIPRDMLFAPPNSPNFFSLGFYAFASSPDALFPGLDREDLLRPPAMTPPAVPNRSAAVFAELLLLLQGYPLEIRDDAHRRQLLRDARYFHFKGIEQQLLPHAVSYNAARGRDEIVLRLENVQRSGIGVVAAGSGPAAPRLVTYARPLVDAAACELVVEIGAEETRLHRLAAGRGRAEFLRGSRARVARLLEVVAAKLDMAPPATGDDLVVVALEPEAAITLDGAPYDAHQADGGSGGGGGGIWDVNGAADDAAALARKRRRVDDDDAPWTVRTGQWRLRVQPSPGAMPELECVLVAVKLDAVSSERARNAARGFLGP